MQGAVYFVVEPDREAIGTRLGLITTIPIAVVEVHAALMC